ncbi:hypothetical protein FQZ97_1071920 [compost metagenome]
MHEALAQSGEQRDLLLNRASQAVPAQFDLSRHCRARFHTVRGHALVRHHDQRRTDHNGLSFVRVHGLDPSRDGAVNAAHTGRRNQIARHAGPARVLAANDQRHQQDGQAQHQCAQQPRHRVMGYDDRALLMPALPVHSLFEKETHGAGSPMDSTS